MSLRFAYNTNGTQNHRLEDAVALIADAGYDGIALTLDVHHLDPFAPGAARQALALRARLDALELGSVIETGARYLLDPRAKHEPTLVTSAAAGRARRVDFLYRCVDVAAVLGSEAVSFWAGVPGADVDPLDARRWLLDGIARVGERAAGAGVTIALEPEPGMLVATAGDWAALDAGVPLALDCGHCLVTGEIEPADAVRAYAADLATVTVEDMRRGEHVHLPFGEGDLDLPGVLSALADIGFERLVCVELSRDSHRAHAMVGAALEALRAAASADFLRRIAA